MTRDEALKAAFDAFDAAAATFDAAYAAACDAFDAELAWIKREYPQ